MSVLIALLVLVDLALQIRVRAPHLESSLKPWIHSAYVVARLLVEHSHLPTQVVEAAIEGAAGCRLQAWAAPVSRRP